MRKTKIICTLGPATDEGNTLENMMRAGMNVARLNFSHGTHEEHKKRMDQVKAVRKKLNQACGIMLDTRGPEVRTKTYKNGKIEIKTGQLFTLTTRDVEGDESIVSITYDGLPNDVQVGTRILIDDGLVSFEVVEIKNGTDIVCKAQNDAPLSNRKSINVPGIDLSMPYISEQDRKDIGFGLSQGIDYIAASFCRCAKDMRELKKILVDYGCEDVQILAKIENTSGVENIEEILREVDGIMVARGDLGVEVPFEELPQLQKEMIKKCVARGKRVITATQMLESMAHNPRPTRAEVSDVANAVYDGTSAIMLSGETSVGKWPVETVTTMSNIAQQAESKIHYNRRRETRPEFKELEMTGDRITNAIAHATCTTSHDLNTSCIVACTDSGATARAVSCFRPEHVIVGATPRERTYHQLSMCWGVQPCRVMPPESGTMLYNQAVIAAVKVCGCQAGDLITVTAGMPAGQAHNTNSLRIYEVEQKHVDNAT